MSFLAHFNKVISAGDGHYLEQFNAIKRVDIQIAIYQKLLYKAGEEGKESAAHAALESIKNDFQNWPSDLKSGIEIEDQRYAVAKANAIYQDYLYQKTFERVKDMKERGLSKDLLFDPQVRLVYELTLTKEEREEVCNKIEQQMPLSIKQKLKGKSIDADLKQLLGGRTPTKTTLCSIDLGCIAKAPTGENLKLFKELRTMFVAKYGRQNLFAHQRASMVASFEESYAHMCLMTKTYESVSRQFDKEPLQIDDAQPKVGKEDWKNIRHKAALALQDKVAESYKKAVSKATTDGVVDLYKLNQNLAKERVKLADFSKKIILENVVTHLKEKEFGREDILNYMQNLSSRVDKDSFTHQTATGYDYFYTSNYLQQGMLITGTKNTAHDKPQFKENIEDQLAYRRVTYTYRDKEAVLQPTSAMSSRIPSPALVFHGMSDELIKRDLVQKFGFLHDEMRVMRGGKDGPAVESLFTSFHSEFFDQYGDGNNLQRASALYIIQAMHDFNTPWSIRAKKLEKQISDFQQTNAHLEVEVQTAERAIAQAQMKLKILKEQGLPTANKELELTALIKENAATFEKKAHLLKLKSDQQKMQELAEEQNLEQPPKNNFIYIQNIGTNRHTQDLGYRGDRGFFDVTGSLELDDITLSAEMAMLHTLQENSAFLSNDIREQLSRINRKVLKEYREFLNDEHRPLYFAESRQGEKLIAEIRAFKTGLKTQLDTEAQEASKNKIESNHLPTLASNTLARMMATNQHWDSRYGQLSQALSMYIEWASTGGCKSGNERNQDVMLRFALLKSIHERVEHGGEKELKSHERKIYKRMTAYINGETADPEKLRVAISESVSQCNMHGGAAAISREDQGGAAKVSSFSAVQDIRSPFLQWTARIALISPMLLVVPLVLFAFSSVRKFYSGLFDTNNAADREMKLDATGASKTQAHKGQDKRTRDVVLEVLSEDNLFTGKGKTLTSEEKDLFKKGSMEKLENEEKQKKQEIQSSVPSSVSTDYNAGIKALSELGLAKADIKGVEEKILEPQNHSGELPYDSPDDIPSVGNGSMVLK
ncbi:hypothetical protein [Legionella sp. PC997]|uniref:hypothetical protein n=1 Tax=Legionella sp. PC997 TaxID=2755562 RepID=UPI0015FCD872|nr:hypothetical protein [Legionella sp. PC997]QMT61874.1 hypothetical protein HBNCFIEN_03282 [Legionella sp. PC997]